ncbi:DNA-binding protein snt1 [Coemansia sp. BCRC 34301]|nr:DNA-binding protein snt1 [Coemansia sp. BCRC 34301]
MSYNRQQQSDSQNSSVAGGSSGGGVRQRGSFYGRDRTSGRQSYVPEGGGGGVVRDRVRSGSVDRIQQATSGSGGDVRSGHSRSQVGGRWAGHDIWYRDENNDRDRERSSWDGRGRRDRDYLATNAPGLGSRYGREPPPPPPPPPQSYPPGFLPRHSVASFGRERTFTPPPPPPTFSRRATEPGEVLEEGELEMDDRSGAHPGGLGSRTYTVPAIVDASSLSKRLDIQSLGFRTSESRRPSSSMHPAAVQVGRLTDRKFSQPLSRPIPPPPPPPLAPLQLSRVPPTSGSRNSTPSPKRLSPTPEPSVQPKARSPSPVPVPPPVLEVQSRITDIDREIAECQERLVMMATAPPIQNDAANDRVVPTSPIAKRGTGRRRADPTGAGQVMVTEGGYSSASSSGGDALSSSDEAGVQGSATVKERRRSLAAVRLIYAENQARAAAVQASLAAPFLAVFPRFVPGACPEPSDWGFWAEAERSHARMRPFLAAVLAREKQQEAQHARQLQEEYADLYARWRRRVDRLDRQREARQRTLSGSGPTAVGGGSASVAGRRRAGGGSGVGAVATADEFGFSLGPLFSATPSAADVGGRGDDGAFTSDAVHSEAELQAIIERLQHDDARSPDARSQRTAATIPDMVIGARGRALLQFANSCHAVDDPLSFYHAQLPVPGSAAHRRTAFGNNGDGDHEWTQAEVGAFVAAYLTHPKEFGVIAACVPHKSMNACVQFYYRNKKQLRLKALEAKANRRARRHVPASRRRKDRARDRRDRRAQEERERIAAEAAASLAAPSDDDVNGTSAEHAGTLERRSRSNALLMSIVQASRRRTHDGSTPALLLPPDDSDASDDDTPRDPPLSASEPPPLSLPPADDDDGDDDAKEDGELVDEPPRRRSRQQSELNAYALGGSIVRTRRSRLSGGIDSDQSLSDAAVASNDSRASPAHLPSDNDEIVEASGVVMDRRPFPRIVSRKSQSRFDVTLTAILDSAQSEASNLRSTSPLLPTESALDRFVTDELSAHSRPISSYETLLICSSAATNSPTRGNNGSSFSMIIDSAVSRPLPLSALPQQPTPLDVQVDLEAGPNESVLVGAAAWLRDDRRRVLRALHRLGADFAQVASLMPSKTMAQCRYFYYHYRTPAGALISDLIPNALTAVVAPTNTAPAIGSLVLPPMSARAKPDASSTPVAVDDGGADADNDSDGDDDDDDDDEDETPLAAQLADVLAAMAAPQSPLPPPPSQSMSRSMSTIAQVPVDVLVPRVTPIASLVLPPKQPHVLSESPPPPPPPHANNNSGDSVNNRSPSLSVSQSLSTQQPPPMTAKKSGYSSYWSVHERSAFMHYAVRLGQDWQALADAIGSKTGTQVRNYFRANRERLQLDSVMVEFERNRAAGTLPPMTLFQPAPTSLLLPASPATAHTPSDDSALKKEKRGRKRKNDMSRSSAEPAALSEMAAKRLPVGSAALPSTAPASMANFPTMGVDGGRAVVFARPAPPPPTIPLTRPPQTWAPPPRPASTAYQSSYLQHTQSLPNAHPPLHAREYNSGIAVDSFVAGRAESGTPSSQPTPPPVEGLPRFSSSPVPAHPPRHYPSMHIASLTSSRPSGSSRQYSPPPPIPARQQHYQSQPTAVVDAGEVRKVSVTKINALLNDDSPPSLRAELMTTADWFGGEEETKESSNDDDATGIAALALASMMGAGRSPQPPPAHQLPVAHPRPLVERQHPAISRHHRPSDPLPPIGSHMLLPPPPVSSMSAFSPVRGSPMPPPMSPHMHSRPSSVGPSSFRHQSPGIPRSLAMSPPPPTSLHGSVNVMRQRKPSAPPPLMSAGAAAAISGYAGRASISGAYPPQVHQPYGGGSSSVVAMGANTRRLPYPMGSSPQMTVAHPLPPPPTGTTYPVPETSSSFAPRYTGSSSAGTLGAHQQYQYHYPPQQPMSPVAMHLAPPPPPPAAQAGMRQFPISGNAPRGYSAGPPPSQQPPYQHPHHAPPQH